MQIHLPRQLILKEKLHKCCFFSPGVFALFQFRCPFATGAAGASRSRSAPAAGRSLAPFPQRDSSPRRSAFRPTYCAPPNTFFPFLSVSLCMGKTAGRREISRGQDQGEPPTSPPLSPCSGFPLPEALCTQRARCCLSIR